MRGTTLMGGNIDKKRRVAVCLSELPHTGKPSGLGGLLTLLIDFNSNVQAQKHALLPDAASEST